MRSTLQSLRSTTALCCGCNGMHEYGFASPKAAPVVAGTTTIENAGSTTTIKQTSNRSIIQWDSFDLGRSEHVDFKQPLLPLLPLTESKEEIFPNRWQDYRQREYYVALIQMVLSLVPVHEWMLAALLLQPAILKTMPLFMAGGDIKLARSGNPDAQVINRGAATIGSAGLAGLVAPHVENHGMIEARLGKSL